MLENVYDVFSGEFMDSYKSWDRFIDFLTVDQCAPLIVKLNHKFEWLFDNKNLLDKVMKVYRPSLLKSEFYDHLGEMYLEKIVSKHDAKRKGQFLTPMNLAELMAKMTIPETNDKFNILDPSVGTGRLLMAAYKRAPKATMFGVDIDIRALRIAFANMAIHKIRGYFLHANSLKHEIDISTKAGKHNWQYANSWYSYMDKLKPYQGKKPTTEQFKLFGTEDKE